MGCPLGARRYVPLALARSMIAYSWGEGDNSLTPSPCGTSPIALALAGAEKVCSSSSRKEKRSLMFSGSDSVAGCCLLDRVESIVGSAVVGSDSAEEGFVIYRIYIIFVGRKSGNAICLCA